MAIPTWMSTLRTNIEAISAIKEARTPDEFPGRLSAFPTALINVVQVPSWEFSLGGPILGFYDVDIVVYLAAQVLPEAYGRAYDSLLWDVRDKIASDIQLGGNAESVRFLEPAMEGPGSIEYGTDTFIGLIYHIQVKVNEAGDYTVSA